MIALPLGVGSEVWSDNIVHIIRLRVLERKRRKSEGDSSEKVLEDGSIIERHS